MNKYLLPWEEDPIPNWINGSPYSFYFRKNLKNRIVAAIQSKPLIYNDKVYNDKIIWHAAIGHSRNKIGKYKELKEAFMEVDKILIEKGFKLDHKLSVML